METHQSGNQPILDSRLQLKDEEKDDLKWTSIPKIMSPPLQLALEDPVRIVRIADQIKELKAMDQDKDQFTLKPIQNASVVTLRKYSLISVLSIITIHLLDYNHIKNIEEKTKTCPHNNFLLQRKTSQATFHRTR